MSRRAKHADLTFDQATLNGFDRWWRRWPMLAVFGLFMAFVAALFCLLGIVTLAVGDIHKAQVAGVFVVLLLYMVMFCWLAAESRVGLKSGKREMPAGFAVSLGPAVAIPVLFVLFAADALSEPGVLTVVSASLVTIGLWRLTEYWSGRRRVDRLTPGTLITYRLPAECVYVVGRIQDSAEHGHLRIRRYSGSSKKRLRLFYLSELRAMDSRRKFSTESFSFDEFRQMKWKKFAS